MSWATTFAWIVVIFQALAGLGYLWQRQWRLAVVWCAIAIANGALAWGQK